MVRRKRVKNGSGDGENAKPRPQLAASGVKSFVVRQYLPDDFYCISTFLLTLALDIFARLLHKGSSRQISPPCIEIYDVPVNVGARLHRVFGRVQDTCIQYLEPEQGRTPLQEADHGLHCSARWTRTSLRPNFAWRMASPASPGLCGIQILVALWRWRMELTCPCTFGARLAQPTPESIMRRGPSWVFARLSQTQRLSVRFLRTVWILLISNLWLRITRLLGWLYSRSTVHFRLMGRHLSSHPMHEEPWTSYIAAWP